MDTWSQIAAGRRELAELLDQQNSDAWQTPSLIRNWTVKDVTAHLVASAEATPGPWLTSLARTGFRFSLMNERDIIRIGTQTPDELVLRLKRGADMRTKPPGPTVAMLSEVVIHGEDIRRPLGSTGKFDEAALIAVAAFVLRASPIFHSKQRVNGLELVATDANWSIGEGPEVKGPLLDLTLAMSGRRGVSENLSGDGVETLTGRLRV